MAYAFSTRRTLPDPPPPPTTSAQVLPSSELTIVARGTTGTEAVEVWVGVHLVLQFTADVVETEQTVTTTDEGAVEVRFINDGVEGEVDRDLVVAYIELDGRRFASASPDTIATGFTDPATGSCQSRPSVPRVDTLKCNGAFRYLELVGGQARSLDLPVAGESIDVGDGVVPVPADARFVAVDGVDGGPGTEAAPWRTVQFAVDQARPGMTIVVRGGTYTEDLVVEQSGTLDAPITLRNYPGERPIIRATGGPGMHLQPEGGPILDLTPEERLVVEPVEHITIMGFEFAGENNTAPAGWASGLSVDYANGIRAVDNVIHGFPGGGVSVIGSDNVLVEDNRIESVGAQGLTQYSGVTILQAVNRGDPDLEPGFRMVVRGNDITDVRSLVTNAGKQFGPDYRSVTDPEDRADDAEADGSYTDANCIIIDDSRHTQHESLFEPSEDWTLVEANTCADNMGRGIHVFLSDNVVARENVLTGNLGANRWYPPPPAFGHDPWKDYRWTAELNATRSNHVRFENNIVDAVGAFDRNAFESSDIVFRGNRYLGGPIETAFSEGASFEDEAVDASADPSPSD